MGENVNQRSDTPNYFPPAVRRILWLFRAGRLSNVASIDVEPEYGYFARLNYRDGRHRVIRGGDLGINPGTSAELSKDKGYAKFMLKVLGLNTPQGQTFLLPDWAQKVTANPKQHDNPNIRTTEAAYPYIEGNFGYPVYVKPVDGSQGTNIYRVDSRQELGGVFAAYAERGVRVALIEKPIDLPDYRIVVLDGKLISAYRRDPLAVIGDGKQTVRELVHAVQTQYQDGGRDTRLSPDDERLVATLGKAGLTLESVLPAGNRQTLLPISNLSAGGTSEDVSDSISPRWVELAASVASNFNLRLCGLDLACSDITNSKADYSILEVNAAPGLDHYAASGEAQQQIVDDLYTRVVNNP
ncbi:MAG TPA: hypothetical protein VN778_05330 [Verrucomicrobiae bacterium]|nr:hypothetical protein [Verrucomicrobiae bacterium]